MDLAERFSLAEKAYRSRIHHFAMLHAKELPGWTPEDLEQELTFTLWKVVETYNPNNGAKFNTYFWNCARHTYVDLLKRAQAEKRKSEWFTFVTELDEDAVSDAVAMLEQPTWQDTCGLTPEEWYLLKETILQRMALAA